MKESKEVFPIQVITKVAAWLSGLGGFIGLAYYFSEEEYLPGLIAFISGVLAFGVLLTIAKIADNIDEIKSKDKN